MARRRPRRRPEVERASTGAMTVTSDACTPGFGVDPDAPNVSAAVQLILMGAARRRAMAYHRAGVIQRELGVVPRLVTL